MRRAHQGRGNFLLLVLHASSSKSFGPMITTKRCPVKVKKKLKENADEVGRIFFFFLA